MRTIDYIKRLIKWANKDLINDVYTFEAQEEELAKVKNADIEIVVRCKNCKWYSQEEGFSTCDIMKEPFLGLDENGFCSYGEEK